MGHTLSPHANPAYLVEERRDKSVCPLIFAGLDFHRWMSLAMALNPFPDAFAVSLI
jgi:hypothetical protein